MVPDNPRNGATENHELLELFDCAALIFQDGFGPLIDELADRLPALDSTDPSAMLCFWYGAAPMSVTRLEEALSGSVRWRSCSGSRRRR